MNTAPDALPTRWSLLALIALVATAALVGVAVLQARQLSDLNAALSNGNDLRVVEMHRQETEYLQLREQWQRALDVALPLDLRDLSLRYDIWVGRMAMLKEGTATRRTALVGLPQLDDTLRQIDDFVRQTDALLAADLSPTARRNRLATLQPQLMALASPMHELALSAGHRVTQEQTNLHLMLSSHSRLTLALTLVLSLLVLAFAALALRQMVRLSHGHRNMLRLSADLQQAQYAAEAANQAKSRHLADMSHEMRTPLQGLQSMLSMLSDTQLDARQTDCLRTASDSADHLLTVLNDVLDLSQLEAVRLLILPEDVALRPLLRDLHALMAPQAQAQQLDLQIDVDASVPPEARLDGTRVKQVLINLLSNALKYSDRGPIKLELTRLVGDANGKGAGLLFSVSDHGIGMDSSTLSRLFNRDERAEAAGRGVPAGTGLGLQIARGLARRMGGDLRVSSVPGQGSRFDFSLPLELPSAVQAAPGPDSETETSHSLAFGGNTVSQSTLEPPHSTAARLRVLVAEDHAVNRQVLAALLDGMGHQSHFVANGDEAVALVQRQAFDLVLMDVHMPGLDGIEATRLIRALPDRAAATVPIVALTADAFTDTRERCLVAGMNDFLAKPVSRDKLGAQLRQLFGSGSGVDPVGVRDPMQSRPLMDDPDRVRLLDPERTAQLRQSLSADAHGSLLTAYFEQTGTLVGSLRKAVRDAQTQDLQQQAHRAHGAASMLGLSGLAATARSLHDGAAQLPAHEVARLVQRFEAQVAATRTAAEQAGLVAGVVSQAAVTR